METTKIQFKKSQLVGYVLIEKPGKYELESSSNVTDKNLVTDESGRSRYIAGFKAIASDKLDQIKAVFAGKDEVSIEQTNGLFLTANIWANEGQVADLPMKGEKVDVTVDYVEAREGGQVLRITNVKRKPAQVASKLDLSTFGIEIVEAISSTTELQHS